MCPAETAHYCGWFRPLGGRWGLVVQAARYDSALEAVLESVGRRSGDLIVLPAGQRPVGTAGGRIVAEVER
jgi:hypothetical protein